jgi:hypothetical protein
MNNMFYGMFFAWRPCQSTANQGAFDMFSQTLRRAPRIVTTRCLTTIALLLAGSQAAATTISLDFSTLPSAQGWTYFSDGALEADVFSVSGGVLSMNSPLTKAAYYRIDGVVDPALPFTLTTRARALSALSASWGVLSYYVGTPTQVAAFSISPTKIIDESDGSLLGDFYDSSYRADWSDQDVPLG